MRAATGMNERFGQQPVDFQQSPEFKGAVAATDAALAPYKKPPAELPSVAETPDERAARQRQAVQGEGVFAPSKPPSKPKPHIVQDTGSGYVIKNKGIDTWVSKDVYEGDPDALAAHLADRAKSRPKGKAGIIQVAEKNTPEAFAAIEDRKRRAAMSPGERDREDSATKRLAQVEVQADALAPEGRALLTEVRTRNDAIEKTLTGKPLSTFRIKRATDETNLTRHLAKMQSDRISPFEKSSLARQMQTQKTADILTVKREVAKLETARDAARGVQREGIETRLANLRGDLQRSRDIFNASVEEHLARTRGQQYANTALLRSVIASINEWATPEEFEQQVAQRYALGQQQMAQQAPAPVAPGAQPAGIVPPAAAPARGAGPAPIDPERLKDAIAKARAGSVPHQQTLERYGHQWRQ